MTIAGPHSCSCMCTDGQNAVGGNKTLLKTKTKTPKLMAVIVSYLSAFAFGNRTPFRWELRAPLT